MDFNENGAPYDDPMRLSSAEIASLRGLTAQSLGALEQELLLFESDTWVIRPYQDAWGAAEIAEHVLLTNQRLLAAVTAHRQADTSAHWREETAGKEKWIRTILPEHGKATANPMLSTFVGLDQTQAIDRLHSFQHDFEEFLSEAQDYPLHGITWSHPLLGLLSAYQWLLYIPFHTDRHRAQLQRTRLLVGKR